MVVCVFVCLCVCVHLLFNVSQINTQEEQDVGGNSGLEFLVVREFLVCMSSVATQDANPVHIHAAGQYSS